MIRFFSFFFSLIIVVCSSFCSFASVATSSDAEYVEIPAISEVMDSVQPYSALANVTNSVDYDGVFLRLEYYNSASSESSGSFKVVSVKADSNGHFVMSKPVDFYSVRTVGFMLTKPAFPSSGTYLMQLDYTSDVGFSWPSISMLAHALWNNVSVQSSFLQNLDFSQVSGDLYLNFVIDINSSLNDMYIYGLFGEDDPFSGFPFGGNIDISFSFTDSEPVFSTPSSNISSSNVEQSISDSVGSISSDLGSISSSIDSVSEGIESINTNTGYMVNGLREMANTLEEIVATISNQLSALWDQLYNNMHLPQLANDDKNTNLIVEAIENIRTDLSVDFSDLIENDNKNHENLVNGYDTSKIDQAESELSQAVNAAAEQEDQLMQDVGDSINDFEFDNPVTDYLSTFQMFGGFLQSLFVNAGDYADVINLSFMMSIALIVLGLYRVKGGGL